MSRTGTLLEEVVEKDRRKRYTPGDLVALKIPVVQRMANDSSGYEWLIRELAKAFLHANYKTPKVIWGGYDSYPFIYDGSPGIGWTLALASGRKSQMLRLCETLCEAVHASGSGAVPDNAEPILKWLPGLGVIRLWDPVHHREPDFPNMTKMQATGLHFRGGMLRVPHSYVVRSGNETITIHNREFRVCERT